MRKILKSVKGVDVIESPPFKELTTIGTGGRAAACLLPTTTGALQSVISILHREGISYFVFGRGSNILLPDVGVGYVAVAVGDGLSRVVVEGPEVTAEGGTSLARLSVLCALCGLSGMEELSGIPGSLGGAVTMNAGAFGRDLGEIVKWVEVVGEEGRIHRFYRDQIRFTYRESEFPLWGVVLRVCLVMGKSEKEKVFHTMRQLNRKRRSTQPWGEKTFGSVFKNPQGHSAGKLIENSGLKGSSVGDAVVSEKHANFIVNRGKAKSSDVAELIRRIIYTVSEREGITLEREVKYIGWNPN